MLKRNVLGMTVAIAAVSLWFSTSDLIGAADATSVALTGKVSSEEEGLMEGVLVSAKKAGSTVTVTVVTDAQGQYSFPRVRLEPGRYSVRIRAMGYELDDPRVVEIAVQKPTQLDLKLHPTQDLGSQLSNG